MKMLITSDWHLDCVTAGVRRFNDLKVAIEETVEAAAREEVDLYLFLGDLCNPDAPNLLQCIGYATEVATALWDKHHIPSRWVAGNHDVIEDGTCATTLSPLKGIERGKKSELPIVVYEEPGYELELGGIWGKRLAFVALPFVSRERSYLPDSMLIWIHEGMKQMSAQDRRVIVAGHLHLQGITPGSESLELAKGREMHFPIETAYKLFGEQVVLLNGHYHERQVYRGVRIPGSLERLTFGESGDPGYLILDVEA